MSDTDIMKMKVADLKRELRLRGLPTTGNKNELQERLQGALIDGELSLEDTAINEDLLDEDGLTDEEEKAVLDSPTNESILITSPKLIDESLVTVNSLTQAQQQQQQQQNQTQPKKVVLKRKNSLTKLLPTDSGATGITTATVAKENSAPSEKISKLNIPDSSINKTENNNNADNSTDQKKVIKLSELSMKERLEMRAKKFGVNSISGTTPIKSVSGSVPVNDDDEAKQIQMLKKRAERFGCVVSSKIVNIEKQEKLLKRQQRFGTATTISNNDPSKSSTTTIPASNEFAEKAKLRLERFKTSATK